MFNVIITNKTYAYGPRMRHEQYQGKEYVVVPVAMLTEGVHNGSGGALYYPPEEMWRTAAAWNFKPVTLHHPNRNGQFVSAADPEVLERQQVGTVMNAAWADGKLRAEVWLDEDRMESLAPEILEALENDRTVEVSTGLFTDNVPAPGTWGGKNYDFVARNHQPDHLALLPQGAGACSVADGCGLLTNKENIMYQDHHITGQPLFGGHVAPTVNHGGDGDNILPLPTLNFDAKPCGCAKPCACGQPTANHGGGDDVLPLPSTL